MRGADQQIVSEFEPALPDRAGGGETWPGTEAAPASVVTFAEGSLAAPTPAMLIAATYNNNTNIIRSTDTTKQTLKAYCVCCESPVMVS